MLSFMMKKSKVELKCTKCGELYMVHFYRANTSKYCSKKCWSRRAVVRNCCNCFNIIHGFGKLYCSKLCTYAHRIGKNHPMWKDGKSLERNRARDSSELKNWRKIVFKRDNYTCQHCGEKRYLHAHHIKQYSDYPELRFEESNGLTLCVICHGKVHGKDLTKKLTKYCKICESTIDRRSKHSICRDCWRSNWHANRQKKHCPILE